MDIFSKNASNREAKIRYLDADFDMLEPGEFVTCAVTGKKIELEDLRYWSVEFQEAYIDAEAALERWKRSKGDAG